MKYVASGREGADSLAREGQLLGDLQHPFLVEAVAQFEDAYGWLPDRPITGFATRWLDADPINMALAKASTEEKIRAFGQLSQVVDYLHRRRYLHLDLKPQNVLAIDDRICLLDLGTALPVESAAGEAGGTLGYAAPEVLAGEAASVASDLYSLGTILYELLAGRAPHTEEDPIQLRAAIMAGQVVPIRAVAPHVPRNVASVIGSLLDLRPANRPSSVRELGDSLVSDGFPSTGWRGGAPPFVGREPELADLSDYLQTNAMPLAIVGEPGSGRSALASRSLAAGIANASTLDLSRVSDPARCLLRVVASDSADRSLPNNLVDAVRTSLRQPNVQPYWVFVGRREEMRQSDRVAIEAVQGDLARVGIRILWAARRCPPGARAFPIPPLSKSAQGRLVDFVGDLRTADQQQLVNSAGGLPGPLLRGLAGEGDDDELSNDLRSALEVLRSLPAGIPQSVLDVLPDLAIAARQLVSTGRARFGTSGQLFVDGSAPSVIPAEIHAPILAVYKQRNDALPALWRAVFAKRIGDEQQTTRLLPTVIANSTIPTREYIEVCEWLGERANVAALNELLRVRRHQGKNELALDVITLAERVERVDEIDQPLRALVVRSAKGSEVCEALCREILERNPDQPYILIELAWSLASGDASRQEEASSLLNRAEAMDPGCAPKALGARVFMYTHKLKAEENPAGLEELMAKVADPQSQAMMPADVLVHAGVIASRLSMLELATTLFERAGQIGDAEGNIRRAGIARLSLGNILLRKGEGRKARAAYREALQAGRALAYPPLHLRAAYSLTELELRSHRLPAAERMLREFHEVASQTKDPQLEARVALMDCFYHRLRGAPEVALSTIEAIPKEGLSPDVRALMALNKAEALFDLGRPADVFDALGADSNLDGASELRRAQVLRGRAHLAMARDEFAKALNKLPEHPDLLERQSTGAALLAAAGEDMDPGTFPERRRQLQRASELLQGEDASRAASIRDRLLAGPGARLTGMAGVIEAIHDPPAFPAALAKLVGEALGANRVLIMLRIPGMGRQITFQELTGEEAAGISEEVLRRIRKPDDVWSAADAFADPNIRRVSATVRTFKIRSVLAVAIPYEGEAIGALYVDDLLRADAFSAGDVEVLKRLAATTARVIPLMSTDRRESLPEPKEILGVLHTDAIYVSELTTSIRRLESQPITNVLITGATGTGKTWLARRLATEVLGKTGIIEAVMRQSEPDKLVGMLGGTKRGDFTGAIAQQGLIKQAILENKALFLDEVQALDSEAQGALLPLLELPKRRFSGLISSTGLIDRPLTIILGTNAHVSRGRWREHFREDFWFRMSQIHIHLPTLAERGPEVIYQHLMAYFTESGVKRPERILEPRAMRAIGQWPWNGNLRELRAAADTIAFHYGQEDRPIDENDLITWRILQADRAPPKGPAPKRTALPRNLDDFARKVLQLLPENGWNQSTVARLLGTTPSRVNRMLKRIGMSEEVRLRRAQEPSGSAELSTS